jgi:hypothetical protein
LFGYTGLYRVIGILLDGVYQAIVSGERAIGEVAVARKSMERTGADGALVTGERLVGDHSEEIFVTTLRGQFCLLALGEYHLVELTLGDLIGLFIGILMGAIVMCGDRIRVTDSQEDAAEMGVEPSGNDVGLLTQDGHELIFLTEEAGHADEEQCTGIATQTNEGQRDELDDEALAWK